MSFARGGCGSVNHFLLFYCYVMTDSVPDRHPSFFISSFYIGRGEREREKRKWDFQQKQTQVWIVLVTGFDTIPDSLNVIETLSEILFMGKSYAFFYFQVPVLAILYKSHGYHIVLKNGCPRGKFSYIYFP